MLRQNWNDNWQLLAPGANPLMAAFMGGAGSTPVTLPHDAMIHEGRTQTTKNQHQTGFYPGGCYTYTKTFDVPADWAEKTVLLEFEGVYRNARVSINGDYAGGMPNGYTEFAVCADDFLKYGQPNTVTVVANNTEENSRWYSGSGIYRNVNLLVAEPIHMARNSLRLTTLEADPELALIQADVEVKNIGRERKKLTLAIDLLDGEKVAGSTRLPVTVFAEHTEQVRTRIEIADPKLWSVDAPHLYTVKARLLDGEAVLDETEDIFGVRTVSITASRGLRINGERVLLRGACIHHDNGVLGAATFPRAEERRVELLKAAGFNCIRSAHHPASRALLDACDRLGVLVLDELSDMWTRPKNNNDYAEKFPFLWKEDVAALVAKDFNRPSVIMYISGNEIQEAGTPKGAQLNREITAEFHRLDPTRAVTVAANGLLAGMEHMGEIMADITGMTMEQMRTMQAQQPQGDPADSQAGADAANGMTDLMKGPMADAFAANHILGDILDEFASVTDVTGYNYLTARHVLEHELHPDRVVLGTETLPSDIVRLWGIVKNHPHVIGDMTWTGWDYLGEASSGVTFYDGRMGFGCNWPISIAGMGDIDIIGDRRPISYIREIVFGLRKAPFIAVEPVNHYGDTPSASAWPWKDEIRSWNWSGYEGKPAKVSVYSDADEVELFLNGVSLGRKPAGEANAFQADFELTYQPGELKAVSYRGGQTAQEDVLRTAGEAHLTAEADRTELSGCGEDLSYIMISLRDENGLLNPEASAEVTVTVEGAGVLQGLGSADVETTNRYDSSTWQTYRGRLLAVVRATQPGAITVTVTSGAESQILHLTAK